MNFIFLAMPTKNLLVSMVLDHKKSSIKNGRYLTKSFQNIKPCLHDCSDRVHLPVFQPDLINCSMYVYGQLCVNGEASLYTWLSLARSIKANESEIHFSGPHCAISGGNLM